MRRYPVGLILTLALAVLVAPLAAHAQPAGKGLPDWVPPRGPATHGLGRGVSARSPGAGIRRGPECRRRIPRHRR
jgi:hypothetical protein